MKKYSLALLALGLLVSTTYASSSFRIIHNIVPNQKGDRSVIVPSTFGVHKLTCWSDNGITKGKINLKFFGIKMVFDSKTSRVTEKFLPRYETYDDYDGLTFEEISYSSSYDLKGINGDKFNVMCAY